MKRGHRAGLPAEERPDVSEAYGVTRVLVHLMLTDARAKALPSFDLPEKIELADFTEADVRVMGSWPPGGETEAGPTWTIHGKIESLEPLALETPEK